MQWDEKSELYVVLNVYVVLNDTNHKFILSRQSLGDF